MDRPHLAVVNTDTGELGESLCADCLTKDATITRLTHSYEGTIRNLKQELKRVTPDDENVRMVLDYWADRAVELGWWSRRPLFEPGDERWQPVRGRLRTRTVDESYLAIEGAFSQSKHQTKRAYVDATSIFRNNKNFEQHLERAVDVDMENVRVRRQLPPELAKLDEDRLAALARRCDCSHLLMEHYAPSPPLGKEPCRSVRLRRFSERGGGPCGVGETGGERT